MSHASRLQNLQKISKNLLSFIGNKRTESFFPFINFTRFLRLENIQQRSFRNIVNYESHICEDRTYSLIFFFGPRTLDELRVQDFLPPVLALHICPILDKACTIIKIGCDKPTNTLFNMNHMQKICRKTSKNILRHEQKNPCIPYYLQTKEYRKKYFKVASKISSFS